jgi:hypothetical protein
VVVHALHIAWWEYENPCLKILPAEKIDAALTFLSSFGHFEDI